MRDQEGGRVWAGRKMGNKLKKQRVIWGLAGIFRRGKEKKRESVEKGDAASCSGCCVSIGPPLQRDNDPDGFTIHCSGL